MDATTAPRSTRASPLARFVASPGGATAARRRAILWSVALAALVRLLFFAEQADSPLLGLPVLDERFYDDVARALVARLAGSEGAADALSTVNPGFRPLLYPAFLALVYATGAPPALALALQHGLGLLTTALVALVGCRLFRSAAAGAAAGCLYALASPPLFFEGLLLNTTAATCCGALFLAAAARAERTRGDGAGAAMGGALSVMAQLRPNALVLLAVPVLRALAPRALPFVASESPRRTGRVVVAALGAALVGLALFAAVQRDALGGFRLLPGAGGVNLYLGNERGADGRVPRQDRATSYGDTYRDSVQTFAEEEASAAGFDASRHSAYWLNRTLDEITAAPLDWLALMGRKVVFLLSNQEIANNRSFAFAQLEESAVLRWLPVRWWLLLALAGAGVPLAWRTADRGLLVSVLGYIVLWSLGILLFFVAGRYRIPLWPALAILAGGGAAALGSLGLAMLRAAGTTGSRASRKRGLVAVALAAALAVVSWVDWIPTDPADLGRDYFYRSVALRDRGDLEGARADAERALELSPGEPVAHFQLGTVALDQGDVDKAAGELQIATALLPGEPRAWHNLGIALERRGDLENAYLAFARAAEIRPDYSPPRVSIALLALRSQNFETARRAISEATALGNTSLQLEVARALLALREGRVDEGTAALERALERDEELTRELLTSQGVRLPPRRNESNESELDVSTETVVSPIAGGQREALTYR